MRVLGAKQELKYPTNCIFLQILGSNAVEFSMICTFRATFCTQSGDIAHLKMAVTFPKDFRNAVTYSKGGDIFYAKDGKYHPSTN